MSEHPELGLEDKTLVDNALLEFKDDLCSLAAPEALGLYVERGIAKGRAFKRKQTRRRLALAACLVLLALLAPIRVSPAYSALISKIPGLDYIVRLINYDHGLVSAAKNDFVQHINLSDEHEGFVFTVTDMIADESRIVLFYTLTDRGKHGPVNIGSFKFSRTDGKEWPVAVGWDGLIGKETDLSHGAQGKVEVSLPQGTSLPDQILVQLRLKKDPAPESTQSKPIQPGAVPGFTPGPGNLLDPTWQVQIPIDKELITNLKHEYVVGKSVTVEGQKFTFSKVTIFPTRISVDVEFDPANTKKVFYFDDLCLVDEHGNKVTGITNGISGSLLDGTHQTLYFQSNYFDNPKEIYLEGHSIRALDKNLTDVKVDLAKKAVVSRLPDQRLTLDDVKHIPGKWVLSWSLKTDPVDEGRAYNLFSSVYLDASGREHAGIQSSSSTPYGPDGTEQIELVLSAQDLSGTTVTLPLEDYPSRIQADFRVKVK